MPRILRPSSDDVTEIASTCARALRGGELVVLPTDTVYGVAAHPNSRAGVQALYDAKLRDARKPIALLAGSMDAVVAAGFNMTADECRLAERFWPGGLTLVLNGAGGSEGVRVPADGLARRIIGAAGGLLRVTSANLSGFAPGCSVEDAVRDIADHVSLAVDGGPSPGGVASTVMRVVDGRIDILREGAVSAEDLESALNDKQGIERGTDG